jgi:peptide deformylase
MILPILSYGSPILRKECDEFEVGESLKELVSDMFETMYAASGVGLAAPQIGISKRIFTVDASPFAEPEEGEELDEKLKELKDLLDQGLISNEQYNDKQSKLLEEL